MEKGKRAWIYCSIDAPEDTHGALKGQFKQLMDFAEQMGVVVIGSSEDRGHGSSCDRPGMKRYMKAAREERVDILLICSISHVSRDICQAMVCLEQIARLGVRVYTPLEGRLSFSFQKIVRDTLTHSGVDRERREDGHGTEKRSQGNAL